MVYLLQFLVSFNEASHLAFQVLQLISHDILFGLQIDFLLIQLLVVD